MESKVRHMWNCPTPNPDKRGAGFPVLENARHTVVFRGTREGGAYNHHNQLIVHNAVFYAMWSNHRFGEDGPGQRVLYSISQNAAEWSDAEVLFPSPQKMGPSEQKGIVLTALRWVTVNGQLHAVARCHANIGFENAAGTDIADTRDAKHPFRARKSYDGFCRRINPDGEPGPILPLGPETPPADNLKFTPESWGNSDVRRTSRKVIHALQQPANIPAWSPPGIEIPRGIGTHGLCEPTVYQAADGTYVILLRDLDYSHRMYVSTSKNLREWPTAHPTDIPDSPSLSTTVTLENGTVLLIGNQMAPKFDNPEKGHYSRDPLMVSVSPDGKTFEKAYALRCGIQDFRVSQSLVKGRGGGAQYPSATVHKNTLYVLYSMGKEDIWISSVRLADIARGP
ncbi:MAG: exo-alpha-sialidase [Candidatus Brocadiia bacterium]